MNDQPALQNPWTVNDLKAVLRSEDPATTYLSLPAPQRDTVLDRIVASVITGYLAILVGLVIAVFAGIALLNGVGSHSAALHHALPAAAIWKVLLDLLILGAGTLLTAISFGVAITRLSRYEEVLRILKLDHAVTWRQLLHSLRRVPAQAFGSAHNS